ncbi:RIP metalloprotease RseP [soil metagenome]
MLPMSVAQYVLAALGLAVLMVVHEAGHYFAAKKFGMTVTRFSIGFGPRIWKYQRKNDPTVFQIALIPFLAYVQIAGMNPYEESDPKDPTSYANASLWARVVTIAAGPLANYFFATILFFLGFLIGGRDIANGVRVLKVEDGGPAATAGIHDNDQVATVNGETIKSSDQLMVIIGGKANTPIDIEILRDGALQHVSVTPQPKGDKGEGKIAVHISTITRSEKIGVLEAAKLGFTEPPKVVIALVVGLGRIITGKEKPQVSGPPGIVKEVASAVQSGWGDAFKILGALSAYLGGFNLLPVPALDGGRLMFLGFEAVARRRPDRKIEARIHALGLLILLGIIAIASISDLIPKK